MDLIDKRLYVHGIHPFQGDNSLLAGSVEISRDVIPIETEGCEGPNYVKRTVGRGLVRAELSNLCIGDAAQATQELCEGPNRVKRNRNGDVIGVAWSASDCR